MRRNHRLHALPIALLSWALVASCSTEGDSSASNTGGATGGTSGAGGAGAAGGTGGAGGGCFPATCADVGAECGQVVEPCGTVLSCGDCPAAETCGAEEPNVCAPGECAPKSCAQLGAACGLIGDGCSSVLDCGECPEGYECGLDTPNQCGKVSTGGSGGSGGGCTPQCAGKQCGPDGCGSTCPPGCGVDQRCTATGQCEDCPSTWLQQVGDHAPALVLDADGDLIVGATLADQAWVARLSACTGEQLAQRTINDGYASSRVQELTRSGDAVYVVGRATVGTQQDGLWARLDASNLSLTWANVVQGSDVPDELWDVDVASDGSVWFSGLTDIGTGVKAWVVKGDASGASCDFDPFGGASGTAHALEATPSGVYVAGQSESVASVLHFNPGACATCPCVPDWETSPIWGGNFNEPRALEIVGSTLFVGGYEQRDDGDLQAFVARVQAGPSGSVLAVWRWNPSTQLDIVLDLISDGQTIYVAVATDVDSTAANATPKVLALPKDFTSDTTPLWSAEPNGIRGPWALALDSASPNALFVVGQGVDAGWAARCTRDGVCP